MRIALEGRKITYSPRYRLFYFPSEKGEIVKYVQLEL